MAEVILTESVKIDTTNDNIVVSNLLEDIPGGKALDVTGWPHAIIPAGHPVIKDDDGEYKPLALNSEGTAIETGAGNKMDKVVGVLSATILTVRAFAPIAVRCRVNTEAVVYSIPATVQSNLSLITFFSE